VHIQCNCYGDALTALHMATDLAGRKRS